MNQMNLDDFKKILMTEPDSEDPEFVTAKTSSLEHARATRESERFEQQLAAALKVPVPEDGARRILAGLGQGGTTVARWPLLAVAAALVAAVGLAALMLRPVAPSDVRVAFVEHLQHPEPRALASDAPVAEARALAALKVMLTKSLDRIGRISTLPLSVCQMALP